MPRILSLRLRALALIVGAIVLLAGTELGRAQGTSITVFAASDLGPAFTQIVAQFEKTTGTGVTLVLGSTGMLTQQIRHGAPADVFFAADDSFINQLAVEHLTVRETTALYARGRIVTVTLKERRMPVASLAALADSSIRRVAIANPQHAPYGRAARQALQAAGVWDAVEPKLVFGENVQQAAQFVRSGSADAGIVARSVADTPELQWTLVDQKLHTPLNQVAVVLARSTQQMTSAAFIVFVNGVHGAAVMRQFGFVLHDN